MSVSQTKLVPHVGEYKLPSNESFAVLRYGMKYKFERRTDNEKMKQTMQIFADTEHGIYENLHACSAMGLYDELISYFQFGAKSTKINTDQYIGYLLEAMIATEQSHLYSLTHVDDDHGDQHLYFRAILCVESRHISAYHDQIYCLFLHLERICSKTTYEREHNSDQFNYLDNHDNIVHGYMNVFCSSFFQKFCQESCTNKTRELLQFHLFDARRNKQRGLLQVLKGMEYKTNINLSDLPQHQDMDDYRERLEWYLNDGDEAFMCGAVLTEAKQYYKAIQQFAICCVRSSSLLIKALCLRDLSYASYMNGQYLLALKSLKMCYNICNGHFLPSFVNKMFPLRKKMIKKSMKTNSSKCECCGKGMQARRFCCSGCMEIMYCTKKCQKLHWKRSHSLQCTQLFQQIYKDLKPVFICFKSHDLDIAQYCA
eukprot:544444_1